MRSKSEGEKLSMVAERGHVRKEAAPAEIRYFADATEPYLLDLRKSGGELGAAV